MRISELMEKLGEAQGKYGDVEVATFDGTINELHIKPSRDGVAERNPQKVNEIVIDVFY